MSEVTGGQPSAKASSAGEGVGEAPPRRKRHRWRRRLGVALLLIVILVWCMPYAISTRAGTRLVATIANRSIPGELSIADLSLTWLGPCRVKGVTLKDRRHREVMRVDGISCAAGVSRALFSVARFGELQIDSPQVFVYAEPDGRVSLVDALVAQSSAPVETGKASSLPAIGGRLVLQNGSVRIVRVDGRQLDASQIKIVCDLDTLDKIDGTLDLHVPKEGACTGEVKVRGLAVGGRFTPLEATGSIRFSTPADISLGELAGFAVTRGRATGKANMKLDVVLAKGAVQADLSTGVTGLQITNAAGGAVEPIDARLSASVHATRELVSARASVESGAGSGQFDATYSMTDGTRHSSLDDALSAILSGKTESLPDATLNGHCQVNLVRLAQAIPALLGIRPDVTVTSGSMSVERLSVRGGNKPSMAGAIAIKDLAIRSDGKDIRWEPMSLGVDALVEPGHGLKVQQAEFASGFGRLVATGSASSLHGDVNADLMSLHRQLSQVFDMGTMQLAGKVTGSLDLKRGSDTRIDVATALATDGFRYRSGERQLQFDKVLLSHSGYLSLVGSKLTEVVVSTAAADVDGKIAASAAGDVALKDKTYRADLNVKQLDLAYLSDKIKTLTGSANTAKYTGNITLQAKLGKAGREAPVLSDGVLAIRGATVGDAPVSTEDIALRWSEASLSPDARQFKVKTAQLSSSPARLSVAAVDCRFGASPAASGRFEGDADLAKLLATICRAAGRDKPPAIAGRLALNGNCDSTVDRIRLTTTGNVDALEVGTGDRAVREKQVRLAAESVFDRKEDALDIARAQLESQLLTLKVGGKVSEFTGARRLALRGEYKGSWDSITALIHELAPATVETVSISGSTGSQFEITGYAYRPAMHPVFDDVSTGVDLTWDSVRAYGLELGKGTLSPVLKQGQLQLPLAVIPASGGGQVRVGGIVDFHPDRPMLYLRDRVQLMENIPITPKLGRYFLSRVNPLFGHITRAEGSASLVVQGVELPLSDEIKRRGAGQGRLDLRNLKIAPGGLLGEVLALGGPATQEMYAVKVDGVDFVLRDGRLAYDNFVLTFPNDFDLRFRGSVGFDESLDLFMSVPVRPALLQRFGVVGPIVEYARLLSDARVEIPIAGTRLNPRLDLARVDIKPLIQRAVRDAATGKTGDLLKNLAAPPGKAAPEKTPAAPPGGAGKTSPAPSGKKQAADLLQRLEKSVTSKPAGAKPGKQP